MNLTQNQAPAQLAKGALRRLALAKLEPTPANFARAYAEEAGQPAAAETPAAAPPEQPSARDWAGVMERLVTGLESGSREWSIARKKESVRRVLSANRRDAALLHKRLNGLLGSWASADPSAGIEVLDSTASASSGHAPDSASDKATENATPADDAADVTAPGTDPRVMQILQTTVLAALPDAEPRARELADRLRLLVARHAQQGSTPAWIDELQTLNGHIQRYLGLRHELVLELQRLSRTLTDSLVEWVDDETWIQGQARSLRDRLDHSSSASALRATCELVDDTRQRQRELRAQHSAARRTMHEVLRRLLGDISTLDVGIDAFSQQVQGYAESAQAAETPEGLASVVQQVVTASQAVHALVSSTRQRMQSEHERAQALEERVQGLETELRRMSEEAVTDTLTRVANRRGLAKLFEMECARSQRSGIETAPLAVGLIDLDNFKKLNDNLGHAAGDEALKALAARVSEWLRPTDHVARYGGEEFVLLLPGTALTQAVDVLTRLQRKLSAALFIHDEREVFVTFSAGVTVWREGEAIEAALARADEGLYEAKRTGKNRTCAA